MNDYTAQLSTEEEFLHKLTAKDNNLQGIPSELDINAFLLLCRKQKVTKIIARVIQVIVPFYLRYEEEKDNGEAGSMMFFPSRCRP